MPLPPGWPRCGDMLASRTSPAGFPAPSVEEWEALSPAERAEVAAALPGEVTYDEMAMPEGERHLQAKIRALDVLRSYFRRQRRKIYLAPEPPTYYPAEPRFAPDLFAVLEVEDTLRDKWVVSAEGKGLDWVLEVHVGRGSQEGRRAQRRALRTPGIPEFFLYDGANNRLTVYRLATPEARVYTAVLPNQGLYEPPVLGLEVGVAQDRLRFYAGTAMLLESEEIIQRLQEMCDDAQLRRERRRNSVRRRPDAVRRRSGCANRRCGCARKRPDAARRRPDAARRLSERSHGFARSSSASSADVGSSSAHCAWKKAIARS